VEDAATDREVENEVAKSSISWKRCGAVRCANISLSGLGDRKKGSSTPGLVPPRLHDILAPGQICKRHTKCARSLDRSIARFGPVSLVALRACMQEQRWFFFLFFCIATISMIHRTELAEFGYKLHTKVEFS
jgi:hypothetical protein